MTRVRLGIGMMIALGLAVPVSATLATAAHAGDGQVRTATRTDLGPHRHHRTKPTARRSTGLEGRWTVGAITAIGDFRAPDTLPPLPRAGSSLSVAGGAICFANGKCSDVRFERQKLGDGPGRQDLPARLGVATDWPYYLVYLNDRAGYGLIRLKDGTLVALTTACEGQTDHCGFVRQTWQPAGK
ncbi:hypothetical protein [Novosphingobium sp.]|uniref:hypothetical protein n=1 Tax=Novosphingobium sp. TaxID=1874826 RepID=UPI00333F948A